MRLLDGTDMMWVMVHQDSHFGVVVEVFNDIHTAIKTAQVTVHEHASSAEHVEEYLNDAMISDGWVYYGNYSPETGSVHVVEKVVHSV